MLHEILPAVCGGGVIGNVAMYKPGDCAGGMLNSSSLLSLLVKSMYVVFLVIKIWKTSPLKLIWSPFRNVPWLIYCPLTVVSFRDKSITVTRGPTWSMAWTVLWCGAVSFTSARLDLPTMCLPPFSKCLLPVFVATNVSHCGYGFGEYIM